MIGALASARALLTGIVDYAGLFPPAGLDMHAAVASYGEHLASADAWALGRFVVPVARLGEFSEARRATNPKADRGRWRLSALAGADVAAELTQVHEFNAAHADVAVVDAVETKLESAPAIAEAARLAPRSMELYVEVPVRYDPAALVRAIGAGGARAKIRTGGVTAEAFPTPTDVLRFMRRCREAGVPFKATAGLHHAVRGSHRLRYDADAPSATMFGFLNVFLAAALLDGGATDESALSVLQCADPAAFRFDAEGVSVSGRRIATAELRRTRERLALSFGSCSFREPLDELRALRLVA